MNPALHLNHLFGTTPIYIGEQLLSKGDITNILSSLATRFVIVTEPVLLEWYAHPLQAQLQALGKHCDCFLLTGGELHKTRESKQALEDQLLQAGIGRDAILIALGGGVVTDLAGFTAATYCRGMRSVTIPTTLLGMVDAAIGGKTGVNTPQGKNLIGSFHQPSAIFVDLATLNTLPEREWMNGLVESLKHAIIWDAAYFQTFLPLLENSHTMRDLSTLYYVVKRSIEIKCEIVSQDEHEQGGIRQLLNFGHTLGHAIELQCDYRLSHGQAVQAGMWLATQLSYQLGYLSQDKTVFIQHLLGQIQSPSVFSLNLSDIPNLIQHLAHDKKSIEQTPRFILIQDIGQAVFENKQYSFPVSRTQIESALKAWFLANAS